MMRMQSSWSVFAQAPKFIAPSVSGLMWTPVRQKGGKLVHAWAFEGDCDPGAITCNTFTIEWPPRSGRQATFPEVDRAGFFTPEEARRKINPGQVPLIDEWEGRVTNP